MAQSTVYFDDGEAYERFMGRWSRAAGAVFLDWLAPIEGARWLDVGCGTGVFTQLILDTRAPSAAVAVEGDRHAHNRRADAISEFRRSLAGEGTGLQSNHQDRGGTVRC